MKLVLWLKSVLQLALSLHSHWLGIAHLDAAFVVVALLRIGPGRTAGLSILIKYHHLVLTSLLDEELFALSFANSALDGTLDLIRVGYCLLHWNHLVHALVWLYARMNGFLVGILLRIGQGHCSCEDAQTVI